MKIYSLNPQYVMNTWMNFGLLEQPYQDMFRKLLHRAIIDRGIDSVARHIYYREQSIFNVIALCFNSKPESFDDVWRVMFYLLAAPDREDP